MKRLLALIALLWLGALTRDGLSDWVAQTELPPLVHAVGTEVRARDDTLLRAYTVENGRWRLAVQTRDVDPRLTEMLIAYEDKRFWRHGGVDIRAATRALAQAVWHGRIVSGGSTLTMQVARLLEHSGTGSWRGKLRQTRLALALEKRLSKREILSLYLHLAPYGGNIEGVRAASLAWLGKEPRRLTPAEAALLVALPQSPETRRPDRHPEQALHARNRVLDRLLRAGVISDDTIQTAKSDPIPKNRQPFPKLAPHIADRAARSGPGVHRLTIDADLQRRLEALARTAIEGRDRHLSVAIMAADHTTGEILASIGAPLYARDAGRQGYIDMTTAVRSPGSTLKPLVYALAFDRGLAHPETLIADTPAQFGTYAPQNFDGQFRGDVSAAKALQLSLNLPVVRLADHMGPAHVMTALNRTGVNTVLPGGKAGLAIVLGGLGIRLTDLMQLYATLAQNGRVTPLYWQTGPQQNHTDQLVAPRAAWMVSHALAGVPPPPAAGPVGRVAFKTGTSYGFRDAWAIGYDGRYVAGVWMGRPDGTPVPGAFGAHTAAPLLFQALDRVRQVPIPLPPPPADTVLTARSGLPGHLQRFGGPAPVADPLVITFPPNDARLPQTQGVPIKWRGGSPPYAIMTNGAVAATGLNRAQTQVINIDPGFATVTVLDSTGRTGSVQLDIR